MQLLLEKHPKVFLPKCKEVHYFSLNAHYPKSWYAAHYSCSKWNQIRGDITPFYLFHPKVPKRIKDVIPNVKMIAMLRDPVERTLSQYFHARRHGFETLELEEAIAAETERLSTGEEYSFQKHSYIARSKYLEQLDRYEKLFPKENLLVIKSEELFNNTENAWREIKDFLKLGNTSIPLTLPHANAGMAEAQEISPRIRSELKRKLAYTAAGVKKRYGFDWGW